MQAYAIKSVRKRSEFTQILAGIHELLAGQNGFGKAGKLFNPEVESRKKAKHLKQSKKPADALKPSLVTQNTTRLARPKRKSFLPITGTINAFSLPKIVQSGNRIGN